MIEFEDGSRLEKIGAGAFDGIKNLRSLLPVYLKRTQPFLSFSLNNGIFSVSRLFWFFLRKNNGQKVFKTFLTFSPISAFWGASGRAPQLREAEFPSPRGAGSQTHRPPLSRASIRSVGQRKSNDSGEGSPGFWLSQL